MSVPHKQPFVCPGPKSQSIYIIGAMVLALLGSLALVAFFLAGNINSELRFSAEKAKAEKIENQKSISKDRILNIETMIHHYLNEFESREYPKLKPHFQNVLRNLRFDKNTNN